MAILITGGAGYIGSHMVYELADRGEQPVVIDDFSSGFEWAIPSGVPVFVEDIGDQRRVAPLIAKYGLLSLFRSRLPNRFDIIATTPQIPEACSRSQSGVECSVSSSRRRLRCTGIRRQILSRKRPPLRLYHLTAHPNSWPKQCCVMPHALTAYATSF
jgi:hypothetical protein